MGLFRTEWSKSPQKITRLSDGTIAFLDIEYKGSTTSQAIHPVRKKDVVYGVALAVGTIIDMPKRGEVTLSKELVEEVFVEYMTAVSSNGTMKITQKGKAIDAAVVECWLVTNPSNDKSKSLGMKNVVAGSVIVGIKSKSKKVLDSILSMGSLSSLNLSLPFDSLLKKRK